MGGSIIGRLLARCRESGTTWARAFKQQPPARPWSPLSSHQFPPSSTPSSPSAAPPLAYERLGKKIVIVDTSQGLQALLASVSARHELYIDLEGNKLSRHGSLDILTILPQPGNVIYVVSVHKLGGVAAFATPLAPLVRDGRRSRPAPLSETAGPGRPPVGSSLRDLLQDPAVLKVLWDVRNDSDALFSLFGVRLAGTVDLQLMELVTRAGDNPRRNWLLCRLDRAVEEACEAGLASGLGGPGQEGLVPDGEKLLRDWAAIKSRGQRLFKPELDGSYDVFRADPPGREIIEYCANDVGLMPALYAFYRRQMCGQQIISVRRMTEDRLELSRSPEYDPEAPGKSRSPFARPRGGENSGDREGPKRRLAEGRTYPAAWGNKSSRGSQGRPSQAMAAVARRQGWSSRAS